jgi:hypothetical protein
LVERERRHAIEQRQQGIAVFARQSVDLERENLPEFDETTAKLLEHLARELGSMVGAPQSAARKEASGGREDRGHHLEHAEEV